MNSFSFDVVYILPPGRPAPEVEVGNALKTVNVIAQIPIRSRLTLDEVNKRPSGSFYVTGEIPSRPNGELVARFGVAWWTDHKDRKHIRIVADVFAVQSWHKLSTWDSETAHLANVYPGAFAIKGLSLQVRCKCGRVDDADKCGWDGKLCASCRDWDRYESENGFKTA
jgi:hypothetical protein